ncbi:CRISPR-associated protein Csx3 [Archaeoglobales archaeon]|nr:MAG: CRISPR-associated protein Csx3 [Archaeoglobales archaeon]
MIEFKVEEKDEYSIVSFELSNVITPEKLSSLRPPKVNPTKGVILSGRGPIWLYCYLAHYYHPTKFIATYDPRLGGAVIVESHSPEYEVGKVIKVIIL